MPNPDSPKSTSPRRVAIGDAVCDLSTGTIETNGKLSRLEPRLCGVLALFIQRGPTVITRDEFLEIVWDNEGSDEALTQAVSRLRKLLGDTELIETVPRIGYRLTKVVETVTVDQAVQTWATKKSIFPSAPPKAIYAGIAIILVGVAAFWLGTQHNNTPNRTIELETELGRDVEFHKIPDR